MGVGLKERGSNRQVEECGRAVCLCGRGEGGANF